MVVCCAWTYTVMWKVLIESPGWHSLSEDHECGERSDLSRQHVPESDGSWNKEIISLFRRAPSSCICCRFLMSVITTKSEWGWHSDHADTYRVRVIFASPRVSSGEDKPKGTNIQSIKVAPSLVFSHNKTCCSHLYTLQLVHIGSDVRVPY